MGNKCMQVKSGYKKVKLGCRKAWQDSKKWNKEETVESILANWDCKLARMENKWETQARK